MTGNISKTSLTSLGPEADVDVGPNLEPVKKEIKERKTRQKSSPERSDEQLLFSFAVQRENVVFFLPEKHVGCSVAAYTGRTGR